MKLSSSNLITVILVLSILCFGVVLYTVVGSSGIRLGATQKAPQTSQAPITPHQASRSQSYGTEVILLSDRSGHYWLDAYVDRTSINFMIDTGASMSVLSYDDAKRVGIKVDKLRYNAAVMTGAGSANFASTRVPYVESGHLRVDNLQVLVAPENALPKSVLGANFLSQLDSYKVESGKMTLVP